MIAHLPNIDEGGTHEEVGLEIDWLIAWLIEWFDWVIAYLPNIDEGGKHKEVGLEIDCLIGWLIAHLPNIDEGGTHEEAKHVGGRPLHCQDQHVVGLEEAEVSGQVGLRKAGVYIL